METKNYIVGTEMLDPILTQKKKEICDIATPMLDGIVKELAENTRKTDPEKFISILEGFKGLKYKFGADIDSNKTDCSGLIIGGMKKVGLVDNKFDTTSKGLSNLTQKKPLNQICRGDFIFTKEPDGSVSHIQVALGEPQNGSVKIIDAAGGNIGCVSERNQPLKLSGGRKLIVGTPIFYG